MVPVASSCPMTTQRHLPSYLGRTLVPSGTVSTPPQSLALHCLHSVNEPQKVFLVSSSSSGGWHVLVAEQRPCDCSPSGPSLPSWGLRTISLMLHNLSVSPVNLCVQVHRCNQPCKRVCRTSPALLSQGLHGRQSEVGAPGGVGSRGTAMVMLVH